MLPRDLRASKRWRVKQQLDLPQLEHHQPQRHQLEPLQPHQQQQQQQQQHLQHNQNINDQNAAMASQYFPSSQSKGSHQQQLKQTSTPQGLSSYAGQAEWRSDDHLQNPCASGGEPLPDPSFLDEIPTHDEPQAFLYGGNYRDIDDGLYNRLDNQPAPGCQQYSDYANVDTNSRLNQPQRDTDLNFDQSLNDSTSRYTMYHDNGQNGRYMPIPVAEQQSNNPNLAADNASNVRYRSMSSEPRSIRKDSENRRARCSSANRLKHIRSRNAKAHASKQSTQPATLTVRNHTSTLPLHSHSTERNERSYQLGMSTMPKSHGSAYYQSKSPPRNEYSAPVSDFSRQPPNQIELPAATESETLRCLNSGTSGTYGYQVDDLEALLSQSSASQPANLPMVLGSPTRLHNMRQTLPNKGGSRPFLPLGVIVNAVFKIREWLYVRTAHGAEGFVPYHVCLPLGILPTRSQPSASEPVEHVAAWEMGDSSTTRGRCRERKRAEQMSANQTDIQKLNPPQISSLAPSSTREVLLPRTVHRTPRNHNTINLYSKSKK